MADPSQPHDPKGPVAKHEGSMPQTDPTIQQPARGASVEGRLPSHLMQLLHAFWPALLLPLLSLGQSGPGGVGSQTSNVLWLDANYHVTVAAGAVSGWSDRSGNGNNATQTVAAQRPVLAGSIHNGYPAILFDNDQTNYDFLRVPDNSTLEGMNGLTGFVVYRLLPGTVSSAPRCFFSKRDGVDVQEAYDWFLWGGSSGSTIHQQLDVVNTNNRISSSTNYTTGTTYLNSFTYHGATPSNTNDQILFDGNTTVGNGTESATSIPNYTSDLYVGILRGHTGTGTNVSRFNGYISEIILYNTVLNDAQRIIVNNYLAAKYNTPLASLDLFRQDDAANGNHDHDVAGIGRTSSTSIQTDSKGTGIVQISGANNLNDGEFLFWGHDNGGLGTFGVFDRPIGLVGRWHRTWRVSELNTSSSPIDVGAVDMTFDLSAFSSVNATDLRLLVDTDNDNAFADEIAISGATSLGGGRYRFSSITALTNGVRFTLGTASANTPLPVELLSFSGEELPDKRVQLLWSTASENGSSLFQVERSTDAAQWSVIAAIPAAGNSTSVLDYACMDTAPRASVAYYRLRQLDIDGTAAFSNIVSIAPARELEPLIWPNPAVDRVQVLLPDGAIERAELVDEQGRVLQVAMAFQADRISLPVHMVAGGQYLLRLWTTNGPIVRKLIITGEER